MMHADDVERFSPYNALAIRSTAAEILTLGARDLLDARSAQLIADEWAVGGIFGVSAAPGTKGDS
jgi:hypothetical protein